MFPAGEFGPERPDERPVARIVLRPDAAVARDPLFAQILRRRTNRGAYEGRLPEPAAIRAVLQATDGQPFRVGVTRGDAAELAAHRAIAAEAWRLELRPRAR